MVNYSDFWEKLEEAKEAESNTEEIVVLMEAREILQQLAEEVLINGRKNKHSRKK